MKYLTHTQKILVTHARHGKIKGSLFARKVENCAMAYAWRASNYRRILLFANTLSVLKFAQCMNSRTIFVFFEVQVEATR